MRQRVLGVDDNIALEIGDALFDFTLADIDALADFDPAQLLDRDFFAQLAAECAIVDAIRSQQARHVFERHAVLLGDTGNCAVEHFVTDVQADAVGPLQLDFR